jgi:2-polyprenyl-6-methoxyphenol hydroxylase-like FAD-dependent oxidoreductase
LELATGKEPIMRVLISGGGIAGLTLAYWLQQYDIPSVVIEQAKDIRRDGYAIDFFGTGYDVAEQMGLVSRLRSQQVPFDYFAYVNASGKLVAKLDAALMRSIMHEKYMALMHWTLEEALYEALASQVEVRFGHSLTRIVAGQDAVVVTFHDGTSESFDLLIGADGVHSLTRTLVFGAEEQYSRFLGYTVASYPLTDRYGIGHTWKMYVEPGRMASAYCSHQEGQLFTFFLYQTTERERLPLEERLPRLQRVFVGMGWITQQLLANAREPDSIFMDTVKQIQMPIWHRGRVALVGDACGCPTLISGQGASLAMGGAFLLAEALHETAEYQEAFRRYEQRMRPHVLAQQKNGRSFAKSFLPASPLGLLVQQILMRVLLRETFTGLLRQRFGAQSILPPGPPQRARPERRTARP